jgi:hypothetical protein
MLARKWDRLEYMVESQFGHDVIRAGLSDLSGADGSPLAEIRDLRRYLLLVEAELSALESARIQTMTVSLVADHADKVSDSLFPTPPSPVPLEDSNRHAPRYPIGSRDQAESLVRWRTGPAVGQLRPFITSDLLRRCSIETQRLFICTGRWSQPDRNQMAADIRDSMLKYPQSMSHSDYVVATPSVQEMYEPRSDAPEDYQLRPELREHWGA